MGKKGKTKLIHVGNRSKDEPARGILKATNKTKGNQHQKNSKKKIGYSSDDAQLYAAVEADGKKAIVKMADDGNCLFRAISDQLYYDYGNRHDEVRSEVCDYLEAREAEFKDFLVLDETEDDEDAADFASYVRAMRLDGEWGGNLELVVAARLYRRNIVVFSANLSAITIDHGSDKPSAGPNLLISYHDNQHYNSVRDNAAPKPKPPEKFLVLEPADPMPKRPTEPIPCEDVDASNAIQHNGDCKETRTTVQSVKDKPTKNSICPCGSGLRYKKCCLAKKKHENRVLRLRGAPKEEDASSEDEGEAMSGGFRVLKI